MRRARVVALIIALAVTFVVALVIIASLWGSARRSGVSPSGSAEQVTEIDFCYVESEIYYGAEAIELAETILSKEGIDDDVRAYAEAVRDETSSDVEELRAWYREWIAARPLEPADEGPCAGHADHAQMPGMPSWSERTELAEADGAEAQALYLELMTTQTEGRMGVAEQFLAADPHPRVVERAERTLVEGAAELDALATLGAASSTGE